MQIDTEKEIKITVNHIPYKLSEDDYDGIWSKLWVKITIWCSIVAGLIFASLGFGIYTFAREKAANSIESYIKSDEFKQHMNTQFDDNVKQANAKLKEIDAGLAKLAIYEAAPFKITGKSLTAVDSSGNHIFIEYGVNSSGAKVVFTSKFEESPTVIVTPYGGIGTGDNAISVVEVTKEHFVARPDDMLRKSFSWIAVGK